MAMQRVLKCSTNEFRIVPSNLCHSCIHTFIHILSITEEVGSYLLDMMAYP